MMLIWGLSSPENETTAMTKKKSYKTIKHQNKDGEVYESKMKKKK